MIGWRDPCVAPELRAHHEGGFGDGDGVGQDAAADHHGRGGHGRELEDLEFPGAGDTRRRGPGADELELKIAVEGELFGELAREGGEELVAGEGHGARGGIELLGGNRGRGGGSGGQQGQREAEENEARGFHQRFMLATFWSISSEVWMDLELIS